MDIILIGAPGAGKGTQAEKLSQLFGMRHIASGDLFEKAFEEQTELGLKARMYVDLGELVPDEMNAELQQLNRQIDLVISLKVSRGELLRRLAGRVFCRANSHVYNVELHPPKVPGVCDLDGSMLYQRPDDTGEAVRKRLVVFFYAAGQVLDHYKKQNKLREVDGNQSIDQVQAMITSEINDYMGKR